MNWVILDSGWEAEFCRVAESHPRVRAYVKNHNLGLEVRYRCGSETRRNIPDFIVRVDSKGAIGGRWDAQFQLAMRANLGSQIVTQVGRA